MELLTEAALPDREQGMPKYRRSVPVGNRPITSMGIAQARLPGGGSINLMRVMQTNACSLSCGYCPTYCGGKVPRATVSPEEVATTFMDVNRKGLAQGLFLTSGVPGRATRATDRMLATLEVLRQREGFSGYIHVKLLPGAETAQVEAAARLATRISVNLEGPTDAHVSTLAKEKNLTGDLLPKLELAGRLYREAREEGGPGPRGSTTTQFVVGAVGEKDQEVLRLVARLERQRLLHHAHFSAFQPVVGTPFEGFAPTPAARESRLYQAEHLLREYGFGVEELAFESGGNLPLEHDPKTAWALAHPERFPLEITRAPLELLLRDPGPGSEGGAHDRGARVVARCCGGLPTCVASAWTPSGPAYYLTLHGRRLAAAPAPQQLRLFAPGEHLTQAPFRTPVPPCAYR